MKSIIFLISLFVALAATSPIKDVEDWQLVPDTEGNLHMVDINAEHEIEAAWNPWNDIQFLLFTRSNPTVGQRVHLNNVASLLGSHYNPAHPARFTIHGWVGSAASGVNTWNTAAYLSRGNFNVFTVDWEVGANTINYIAARQRIDEAGLVVAQFIDFISAHGTQFASIVISGHSLGAHVAGMTGKQVTRGRVGNIVGLDPALPLFSFNEPNRRLHHTDANYVEIIHTDIGRLGFDVPIGHASFYPNWGRLMPGCGQDLAIENCSHSMAWRYFSESIRNPNAFWGTRCSGWPAIQAQQCPSVGPSMAMGGEPVNTGANGVFFMPTNENQPWGQGWRP